MLPVNFDTVFIRTISPTHEGSAYVNDPNDPGGESKFGISKRAYPKLDIKSLTIDVVRDIYLNDFWNKCPDIPFALKYQVYDFAINSGFPTAIRYLQRTLYIPMDGVVGPQVLHAINTRSLQSSVLNYISNRMYYMLILKNWVSEGRGWTTRMAMNLQYGAIDLDGTNLP